MKTVFEPFKSAGITFSNKIIRSATFEGVGDENGKPTDQLIKKYEALAKGGVGGIITGFIGVGQQGKASDNMVMINKDENIETLKKLTKRMHEMETPIIAQLNHCGGQSKEESAHMPIVAPSKISDYKAREMTKAEILEVIEMFVQGIKNAKEAGFDGVQIHLAHGYLLSEFLSPRMNRRKDEWGGSTKNRFRIIKMIFEKARNEVGDYPMIVKLNGYETLNLADDDFYNGRENSMISLSYLELYAPSLELGSCWAGVFEICARSDNSPMYKIFNIPEKKKITGAVMVGYPKYSYKRFTDRQPLSASFYEN